MSPTRIQRQGWRKPEGAVFVDRPSPFVNPYVIVPFVDPFAGNAVRYHIFTPESGIWARDTKQQALAVAKDAFSRWVRHPKKNAIIRDAIRRDLRGKDLCCWCRLDEPCHADVLLEIANEEPAR